MSDIAGIAGNAVAAYQNALSTVSNNIANVATDGYSRQDVALSALPVTKSGGLFLGSGVVLDNVKRQYDAFVESNLRNSTSDLASQGPMVNYANRVVDVMGGQTMGLNTALDQFFSSARALSADTSSTVLRSSFVRDAQSVTQRFGQLSEQLDLIGGETQSSVDNAVSQSNNGTKQLGVVNGQLTKQMTEAKQPPDLLDQRDLLLKKLSELAHINTAFAVNGQVKVSLGPTVTQDVVVSGTTVLPIGANYDAASSDKKVTLVLDPYGKSTPLSGITSGTLAGLMAFREQVLVGSHSALDNLAKTFASESNTIHEQGVDAYGNPGQALFSIDPNATNAATGIKVAFDDPLLVAAASQFRVTEDANNSSGTNATLIYNSATAVSTVGPASLSTVLVNNDHPSAARNIVVSSSVPVTAVATIPQGMSDVGIYLDTLQPGQQLQILTRDGRQLIGQSIAQNSAVLGAMMTADNGFQVGASYSDAYLNSAKQSVQLTGIATAAQSFLGVPVADTTAGNSAAQTAALIVSNKAVILAGAAAISAGITDLAQDPSDPTKLIITTNQTSPARPSLSASISGGIQFGTGADLKFKGMTVFYGAQASVQSQPVYNSKDQISGSKPFPAVLQGGNIQGLGAGIPEDAITIDGISLGPLSGPVANAKAVADWLNTVSSQTAVIASATNVIQIPDSALKLRASSLMINDSSIDLSGVSTKEQLAAAINTQTTPARTFAAHISPEGILTITNAAGHEGEDINIGNLMGSGSDNALGVQGGIYRGQVSLSQPLLDKSGVSITKPIQLGFGNGGTPSQLAELGFRTGAFITGAAKDDLLVFVTGSGSATVSASYSGAPIDGKQALRTNPMNVEFLTATNYRITDTNTGTVLAERTLDPTQLSPAISYQGLLLSFTSPPRQGDRFALDGNQDGIGNNENMLAMNALESKNVVGNKTLSNAYIDHVNEMGNIARQATISQTALTVVHDQAVTSRDQISGVSLDKEAGDLIRYQQAYQAAAKTLQVASQLFDSVLQIR
jgi:flagellar hook-associated protein FlgK